VHGSLKFRCPLHYPLFEHDIGLYQTARAALALLDPPRHQECQRHQRQAEPGSQRQAPLALPVVGRKHRFCRHAMKQHHAVVRQHVEAEDPVHPVDL
jgi:hypothetical protein